jgi:MATE family multidrug resistance protein
MSDMALNKKKWSAWATELRATVVLSWPLVLTNVAQTALTAIGVLMMGRLGTRALAAGTLGANLFFAVLMFGVGLMSAAAPMIANELGRNRHAVKEVRRTVRQGLWSAVMISLPMWVLLWQGEPILLALGQEPDLAHQAGGYLRALQWSTLPFFAYLVLRSYLAALQQLLFALLAVTAALVFNVAANWCLMFGNLGFPNMGLPGSGLATSLSSILMFAALVLTIGLDRRFRRYRLFGRLWRPDWSRFRQFWALGLPIGVALAFEVTIFNAAVFLMGLIGADSLAAHSIAIQIASLTFMVPLGIGQAATVRVGRAYGARDPAAVGRAGWTAFALAEGFMCLSAATMLLTPRLLISPFLDLTDPANRPVIEIAVSFLAVAALFQIADGAQVVGASMLRGLRDTRLPMFYTAIGYWGIGLPLATALGFATALAGIGIWFGLATGLAVVAVLMIRRWIRREVLGLILPSTESAIVRFSRTRGINDLE